MTTKKKKKKKKKKRIPWKNENEVQGQKFGAQTFEGWAEENSLERRPRKNNWSYNFFCQIIQGKE